MPTPDVRVRLSAEGVAEVVAALKKVQAETEKTSAKQSRGFLGLNRALGSTTKLLGFIGVALGVAQFKQWIKSSTDAADQIGKLGQKVGASTEHLSALHLVARTSASSLEEMGAALANQNKFLAEAAQGNPKAIATLRNLRLTIRDFKGKDSVEIFELIAKRISEMPAPIQKTKTAMDIFGSSGANLIPTMNALADEGLGRVIERARELGVLIDTKLADSARQMNSDFELLKAQAEGIGTRIAAGLVPHLSQALQIVGGDIKRATQVWENFGQGMGLVVKFMVTVVRAGFDLIGTYLGFLLIKVDSSARAFWSFVRGRFDEAKAFARAANQTIEAENAALAERMKARFELLTTTPPPPKPREETPPGDLTEDPSELAAKRAQAMQATLDRELALARTMAGLRNAAEKRAFEEGLKDIRAYFAARRRIAEDALAKEIEVLEQKRGLLEAEPDPGRRLQEEGKIEAELAKARLEHGEAVAALLAEERDAVRKLGQERLAIEKEILEAQGKRLEAALLGIDEEIRKADLLLRKQGAPDAERQATLDRLRRSLETGIRFDEAKRQAEGALSELDAARAEIEARISAGLLSQVQGEQQLLAIEEERLAALERLAQGLEAAARATGDPEKIAQAVAFSDAVHNLGLSIEGARGSLETFAAVALDAGRDALAEFFDTGVTGSKSVREAFRDMVLSILADLRRLAAQKIATSIISSIPGFAGGGAPKKATGGLLRGGGTGTSDSNLAWFSRGEYLVRAAIVREPGILEHLEALNRSGRGLVQVPSVRPYIPQFAAGGLVGEGRRGTAGSLDGRLLIGLDEGLILSHLESPAGQRILVKAMSKNRRAIRAALGN